MVMRHLAQHRVANEVHRVSLGEHALDYVFQRGRFADPAASPRPSLILVDLRLPTLDGIGVLKEIKSAPVLRPIPIVILSSSASEKDVARAYEHHANSYLVKPVNFEWFNQLMDAIAFYWLACNHQQYPQADSPTTLP